jgi:predicted signal transduction protein with EAL and GGDEF domain
VPLGTGTDDAVETVERIRNGIRADNNGDGAMSVSIGVAMFPDDAGSKAELLDKADWAMYAAKRAGRDRVVVFGGETPARLRPAAPRGDCAYASLRHREDSRHAVSYAGSVITNSTRR